MKFRNQHDFPSPAPRLMAGLALAGLVLAVVAGRTPFAESGAAVGQTNSSDAKQQHWSLRPVVKPAEPEVADIGWIKTPVDRFILSKLERAGIKPSPPADKRTLLRRATFDLTG